MKTFKKAHGMQVASLAEGALLGKLEDFQFDLEAGTIYGYRIKGPGVFGKTGGVSSESLVRIGRDLVYIRKESEVEWAGEKRNPEEGRAWASRYLKSRVMTRRGAGMGQVEDFLLAEEPPEVVGLVLDGGRMVRLDARVALGKDAVILEDASIAVPMPEGQEEDGWWDRIKDAFSNPAAPAKPTDKGES